ncbi:class I SAM-dependent methyltransferase [Rhodospirillaceae bacterium]|nr:class I SAM-dependent methyltransferase [Rhodospirillaceae bacterium]
MTQFSDSQVKEQNNDEVEPLFLQQLQEMIKLCSVDTSDDAVEKLKEFSERFPKAALSYSLLGIIKSKRRVFEDAIKNLKKALLLLPTEEAAQTCLLAIYKELSRKNDALDISEQCVIINPSNSNYWDVFCGHVKSVNYDIYEEKSATRLVKILEKDNVSRPAHLLGPIITLLQKNIELLTILKLQTQIELDINFEKVVSVLTKIPLFAKIIERCPIPHLAFEQLLQRLRKAFLTIADLEKPNDTTLKLQCALALHCFTNEYIYGEDEAETSRIVALEKYIVETLANKSTFPARHIACLASYRPLVNYSWANDLIVPELMKGVFSRQVYQIQYEHTLIGSIQSLSKITENTSVSVKKQYEENPYPRWVSVGMVQPLMTIQEVTVAAGLRTQPLSYNTNKPNILIAGCGTGQHSLEAAARYNNSHIIGIDLSLSSLSFALRRTKELGIDNIEYLHGDILNIGNLGKEFDVVEAMGVLHHMKFPKMGWRILKDCLKPGGLMRIGLYSTMARQDLLKIKEELGDLSLPITHQKICDYRKKITTSKDPNIQRGTRYSDFYATSELRDLLFHVQEHTFTLPQIKGLLEELNLTFCGFESVDESTREKLANGKSNLNNLYSLDSWHEFEMSNPDYFTGMYSFWVQKTL